MFFELQSAQIDKWLLNPYMYIVVGILTLISMVRGIDRLDRYYWQATVHDFLYGLLYAGVYAPIIMICLLAANHAIDVYLPWLRVDLLSDSPIWVQFPIVVLLDDFLAYWSHRLRHVVKPLWYFHAIHHSQKWLNPFTTKRFHPLENLLHKLVILLVPMAIVGGSLELLYLYFLLDAVWDYFIHSNIRWNLGPLKYWVVSPQYHRVHHSSRREQFDKNFSDRFVVWDRLFGTLYKDFDVYPATGIPEFPRRQEENHWHPSKFILTHIDDLVYPFKMILLDLKKSRNTT